MYDAVLGKVSGTHFSGKEKLAIDNGDDKIEYDQSGDTNTAMSFSREELDAKLATSQARL
jgi:hypothetical protein